MTRTISLVLTVIERTKIAPLPIVRSFLIPFGHYSRFPICRPLLVRS
jgi:hypothetical protein